MSYSKIVEIVEDVLGEVGERHVVRGDRQHEEAESLYAKGDFKNANRYARMSQTNFYVAAVLSLSLRKIVRRIQKLERDE